MYKLEQIFAALATVENGPQMIVDLQTEFGNIRGEAANHRTSKNKILQSLGIQEGDDAEAKVSGIVKTLDALKNAGDPSGLGRQIADLTAQVQEVTGKLTASEQKAAAERDKRIGAIKHSSITTALAAGNALSPETFAKVIMDNIVVKDDDSLAYKGADSKEISVEDGVKSWLEANPWAVKNQQQAGGGSGSGGAGGGGTDLSKMSTADYVATREAKK